MKPSYSGYEAKENKGFLDVPPVGQYEAEIKNVRYVPADEEKGTRECIELYIDIANGEYKGRYMEIYSDQVERYGKENSRYKGLFRLIPYHDNDEDWVRRNFEGALWCVEQSNPDYHWDWNEAALKGKKVGINVRKYLYTYNNQDRETTEIGKLETISDVKNGKCKALNPRDKRKKQDDQNFTDVSKDSSISVPW